MQIKILHKTLYDLFISYDALFFIWLLEVEWFYVPELDPGT